MLHRHNQGQLSQAVKKSRHSVQFKTEQKVEAEENQGQQGHSTSQRERCIFEEDALQSVE